MGRDAAYREPDAPVERRGRGLFSSGLAANATALALSALTVLLTMLVLGAEGRGQIAVLTVLASYCVVAVGLSLESGILHYGGGLTGPGRSEMRRRSARLALATFAVGVVVLAVAAHLAVQPPMSLMLTIVFAVGYAAPVLVTPATAWDRLEGRHHAATWRSVAVLIAQQGGGAVGLWVHPSATSFVTCGAVASVVAVVIAIGRHLHGERAPASVADGREAPDDRRLLTYSLSGHGGVLLHLFAMRAPLIAVSATVGLAAAGIFSVASSIAEITLVVTQAQLGRVLAAAAADRTDFTVLRRQLEVGALLSTLLGGLLVAIAALVPHVLSTEFDGVVAPTAVLVPGLVALGLWRLASNDLAARGRAGARSTSAACGALVVIVLLLALVPPLSILGAAIAASIGFVVMAATLWLVTRRAPAIEVG